jgi:hypothetical protein
MATPSNEMATPSNEMAAPSSASGAAVCGECDVSFRTPALLRRHLARYRIDADTAIRLQSGDPHAHGPEFVGCELCLRMFSSLCRLRTHRRLCRSKHGSEKTTSPPLWKALEIYRK